MKTIDGVHWFNCDITMPDERKLVLLTGPSGYVTHPKFLTLGYYDNEYRPPINGRTRWLNVQNDDLSDQGWVPTHWAKAINLP